MGEKEEFHNDDGFLSSSDFADFACTHFLKQP